MIQPPMGKLPVGTHRKPEERLWSGEFDGVLRVGWESYRKPRAKGDGAYA